MLPDSKSNLSFMVIIILHEINIIAPIEEKCGFEKKILLYLTKLEFWWISLSYINEIHLINDRARHSI